MKEYVKKIINGKLLILKVSIKEKKVKKITISGDFFFHPEKILLKLEKSLKEKNEIESNKIIDNLLKDKKVKMIGFSIEDIKELLNKGFNDEMEINNR